MYSSEKITTLSNRIGFSTPQESGFTLTISEANLVGSSGRVFSSFHSLVTVENIHAGIEKMPVTAEEFNIILDKYRKSTALEIVPLILDKHKDYDVAVDYDSIIDSNIVLFDDAIGYKVAMMVLEMFISTKRSNIQERNAKLTMSNLKLEIEGFKNDAGVLVASGLVQKFNLAIKRAANKIFPVQIVVTNGSPW